MNDSGAHPPTNSATPSTSNLSTPRPSPLSSTHPAAAWTLPQRLGFRLAFCYLVQYALACGNDTPWRLLPWLGRRIEPWVAEPYLQAAQWFGVHALHLHGVAAQLHGSAFGDRALDWVAAAEMLALALLAAAVWSVLDRRRREYESLLGWFRLGLRLAIAVAMLSYGSWKLFPIQMPEPSLAVLNEPLGSSSPLALLWTLLGMSPGYERICGVFEFSAGLLLLRRRTALAGALLTAIIMSNVLLFNLFYDVPVKLYAAHLLLMALVVLAPELPALLQFLFAAARTASAGEVDSIQRIPRSRSWQPQLSGRLRWLVPTLEALVLLTVGLVASFGHYRQHAAEERAREHPAAWTGLWTLEQGAPPATGDGLPMTQLVLEPSGRVDLRASDGVLWGGPHLRPGDCQLVLAGPGLPGTRYTVTMPDPQHLVLTPIGKDASTAATLQLTRVPLPAHYPLLERGFHLVNEWGYER